MPSITILICDPAGGEPRPAPDKTLTLKVGQSAKLGLRCSEQGRPGACGTLCWSDPSDPAILEFLPGAPADCCLCIRGLLPGETTVTAEGTHGKDELRITVES